MVTLDGSTLEGGGQLVRVALSLSSICSIPLRVTNIRANRAPQGRQSLHHAHRSKGKSKHSRNDRKPEGGLKESHLVALNWLADKCNADVQGNEIGCRDVIFKPARRKGNYSRATHGPEEALPEVIELQKPGSVWLIWQAIFPYIVFSLLDTEGQHSAHTAEHTKASNGAQAQSEIAFRIILKGGTNVPKSPSSEYMQQVFLPLCRKIGLPKVDVVVKKRGWAGSAPDIGEVDIIVHKPDTSQAGCHLPPFHLHSPGPITSITMTIIAGSTQTHTLLETEVISAIRAAPTFTSLNLPITLHPSSTSSGDERRLYILLVAHTVNGYALGRDYLASGKNISSDNDRRHIIDQAVRQVVHVFAHECERGGCVDEFAEDQIVVFQALASGKTSVVAGKHDRMEKEREMETGSLHTRTVRWVCYEVLGTVFDGQGGCEGRFDGDVETVSNGLDGRNISFDGTEDGDDVG
ncbi:RNA 3'-terminal phosphate cyclase/enolpyruvate transferase [Exophiala viscosa]|uniref:RNA 3'-terminal phosphate cyclase/enolpyruvate transferase n=1 Tax=Exophiala viscosa TaxID=2486360 RepID=A0AAN6IFL8_9EURO|nr:RNA 3'-terminal phosphate cyclase/enolpyruvate transferase [Exophiala viscosa]